MNFRIRTYRHFRPLLAGMLLSLVLAGPARAIDYIWNGIAFPAIGIWGTAGNWAPNGVPGAGDTIRFNATTNLAPGTNRTIDGIYANGANIDFRVGRSVQVSTIWAEVSTTISNSEGGNVITNNGQVRYENAGAVSVNIGSWQPSGTTSLFSVGTLTYGGVISGATDIVIDGGGTTILTALNTYTGNTTVSSGTLTATGAGNILPSATDLNIAGGQTCNLDDQTLASLQGSGTLNLSGDVDVNEGGTQTFGGNITQGAASTLTMQGSGSLTLTGNVASALEVSGGSMVLNGTSTNTVDVSGTGTFLGTGSTTGLLSVTSGNFGPGNSIGVFNASGGLTMGAGGVLNIEVSGGTTDQVNVTGAVNLGGGTLNVTGTPTVGAALTIVGNDGVDAVTNTFSGLAEGATFSSGGSWYEITYTGGDGNDVVLTAVTAPAAPPDDPPWKPDPEPLRPPNLPEGSGPGPAGSMGGIKLTWTHVDDSQQYHVYRADCPTCPRAEIGMVEENSFTDVNTVPGRPYYYWLRSENENGLGDYSNWMAAWRYEQNPGRAGDFNGDGITDLLWWDPDTNRITIWYMDNGSVKEVGEPLEGLEISQWLLIGIGDLNGDGVCDILWWSPETGEVLFWYLPSVPDWTSRSAFQVISTPCSETMSGNMVLSYLGDLNGDGREDILWRDYAHGEVTLWLMGEDGQPQYAGPPIPAGEGVITSDGPAASGTLNWQVGGLADADGSGKTDVIWKNALDNSLATWAMDGFIIAEVIPENQGPGLNWRLAGLGNLDADNQADVVWRNEDSGEVRTWLMRGGLFMEERIILEGSAEAVPWRVKAVGAFREPGRDDIYLKHSESGAVRIITLDGQEFWPVAE